jgi:hypothetical protein
MSKKKILAGSEIEFEPDAWRRFERAIDVVAKSPPQHRKKKRLKKGATTPKGRRSPVKSKS